MLTQFFNDTRHKSLSDANLFAAVTAMVLVEHKRADSMAEFNNALTVELGICLDNGIGADYELLRQRSNCWQLFTWSKQTTLSRMSQSFHQLKVNGNAGRRIYFEER
jgi:hypothetical protein